MRLSQHPTSPHFWAPECFLGLCLLQLNHILVRNPGKNLALWLYFTLDKAHWTSFLTWHLPRCLSYQLWRKWHLTEWHFLWQAGNFRDFKTTPVFSQKNSNAISWVNKQPWGIQWEWSSWLHSTHFRQTPMQCLRISNMYIHKARNSGLGYISIYENEILFLTEYTQSPQVLIKQQETKTQLNIQKLVSDVNHTKYVEM